MSGPADDTRPWFPVVRHLSGVVTPYLMRFPLTPNQITTASLIAGMAGNVGVTIGGQWGHIVGALLLIVCYVLDNCDGEIARLKNLSSPFGAKYDSFVDWIVHATFFVALGTGAWLGGGEIVSLWLGWIAGIGATINYCLGLFLDRLDSDRRIEADPPSPPPSTLPRWLDLAVLFFRELTRADFCFIVLLLALMDELWVLLPLAAVGSQVYWIMQLLPGARRHHV